MQQMYIHIGSNKSIKEQSNTEIQTHTKKELNYTKQTFVKK